MKSESTGLLMRIFLGESDRWRGKPLYQAIVERARELGLAGATVFKGHEGYGSHSLIHTARILRLSEDLPVLVEIVDTEENIEMFLPVVEEMADAGGLVMVEKVRVVRYGPRLLRRGRKGRAGKMVARSAVENPRM